MADTFVLVHGAWHGSWCWAAVVNQLEQAGDRALALDLPSHGTNRFDRSKVTLEVYAASVARFIEQNDLRNVVLAGHSMGGLVISQVAQKVPRRLKRVVFVTAMVMLDGEKPIDPTSPEFQPLVEIAKSRSDLSLPIEPMAERFRQAFIQDGSPDLQEFVIASLMPQPIAPLIEPVPMKEFFRLDLPSSYLICEDDLSLAPTISWHPHYSSRLNNPTTRTIKSGHEVMFTRPAECAKALRELAAS